MPQYRKQSLYWGVRNNCSWFGLSTSDSFGARSPLPPAYHERFSSLAHAGLRGRSGSSGPSGTVVSSSPWGYWGN